MKFDKAIKAALNYSRDYVPIKTGKLRYKFIQRDPSGNGIIVKVTGYNYPDLINNRMYKISNPTVKGSIYTKDWEKTLAITAYAETKEQSKLIDEFINNSEYKFKRIIQKQ